MRTKMNYSEVLAVDVVTVGSQTLLEVLSKSAGLEGTVCVLEGCRKYYPNADGTLYPDITNGNGAFLQVKGDCGGFNAIGYTSALEAMNDDYSNYIVLGTLNKHGLHIYRIPLANMSKLVEANIFRLSMNRYRVRKGLMKHHVLLLEQCDRYYKITENEATDMFTKVQNKIRTMDKDGRLIP